MAVPPFRVKALYDYTSQEEDDLKFKGNQLILVTDEEDADWYFGEYEDETGLKHEGLFPKNFVKIFEPEAPPRPQKGARSKKDVGPPSADKDAEMPDSETNLVIPSHTEASISSQAETSNSDHLQAKPQDHNRPAQPQGQTTDNASAAQSAASASKGPISAASKPSPPAVNEKPASNAFRDRINAFNKPAAPPVAPMKPGGLGTSGGSGFIKKPFVAPPPSKNAYVPPPREPPPQKLYRWEEDQDALLQASEIDHDGSGTQPSNVATREAEEDQPKPTSLKDRIALLQKQQMEQAARHAEAGQKKEKAKRPKKSLESEEAMVDEDDLEGEELEKIVSPETTGKRSTDSPRRHRKSREETPMGSPVAAPSREILSDGNDADQSGAADTEEGEESSTGRDDNDSKTGVRRSLSNPSTSRHLPQTSDTKGATGSLAEHDDDVDEEEDEEDVDPEVKRRMEIRERMAKMSGGMGMAGMFGPPGGLPARTSTKKNSAAAQRKDSANSTYTVDSPASRAAPVPILPIPGSRIVSPPEVDASQTEVAKEEEEERIGAVQGRELDEIPDIEDIEEEPHPAPRRSTDRPAPPPIPQERPVPPLSDQGRAPPATLSERSVPPPPPATSRPVPPPPPRQVMSPSEGSESDDESSSYDRKPTDPDSSRTVSKDGRSLPSLNYAPSIPHRPQVGPSQPSEDTLQEANISPTAADEIQKRTILPTHALPSAPQSRAPPPPPPPAAALARSSTGDRKSTQVPSSHQHDESDGEVTEYDGDYDTDIASGAAHKDALKAHARAPSLEDESITEEASLHHSGLPSIGPHPSSAPRAIPPPPPPQQPPQIKRQSSDMPRGAPPPPPPPKQEIDDQNEDYDPYNYTAPVRGLSSSRREDLQMPRTPTVEEPEPSYSGSTPQHRKVPSSSQTPSQYPSPNMSVPGMSNPRQSSDIQRTSTTIRRSTDMARSSGEHYMASDVDLGQDSRWWAQAGAPPPVFQDRRDVIFEFEENSTTRRGGKKSVTKDVYVLYMDYSQTVVTAHFEATDPSTATLLEQRHEPPPRTLRQDQLEEAHARIGARIADAAKSKEGSIVGDGTPHALPFDLIHSLSEALEPVGVRAYGALVYANLANASVQQHDEIRPGDIVTFRNTKFGGHRGPMKGKYSIEVGKPDHVGVVVDWDGTKKKVRAWEQGRESKKVKIESFKFGDMKSGEVKVWRVMGRGWVGWEETK